jgi:hypothetical protein
MLCRSLRVDELALVSLLIAEISFEICVVVVSKLRGTGAKREVKFPI